ncbi:MAG: hypothetical protein FH758_01785 [Firmicutes bacterium]|nr:hypothetical protein [Bacillota bacterium]
MSGLLQKSYLVLATVAAAWFSFVYAAKPSLPVYHNTFLFVATWLLFYSFMKILIEEQGQGSNVAPANKQKKKKIRRKNNNAVTTAKQ